MNVRYKVLFIVITGILIIISVSWSVEYSYLRKLLNIYADRDLNHSLESLENSIRIYEQEIQKQFKILVASVDGNENRILKKVGTENIINKIRVGNEIVRGFYYGRNNKFSYIYIYNDAKNAIIGFREGFELHENELKKVSLNDNFSKYNNFSYDECYVVGVDDNIVHYTCRYNQSNSSLLGIYGYVSFGLILSDLKDSLLKLRAEFRTVDEKTKEGIFFLVKSKISKDIILSNISGKALQNIIIDDREYLKQGLDSDILGESEVIVYVLSSYYLPMIKSVCIRVLILIAVSLIVAGMVIWLLNKYIMIPVESLSRQIKSIRDGDYSSVVQYDSSDEISEFAETIEQMRRSLLEKMNEIYCNASLVAIGQSAATIAHDVRRPLAAIKGLLSSLPAIKDDSEQIDKMVARVDRSIVETNAMLDDILDFSKDASSLEISKINPQGLIISSLSSVFRGYDQLSIVIDYHLNHKNFLKVDAYRIGRVINNIIGNAIEAMDKRGKLWVRTDDLPENKMKLVLGNDGPVIPEDILDKMFEPFFTKGKKNGTGLGLSICQKIIEMHGGTITVTSTSDENGIPKTEFVLTLPSEIGELKVNEAELINHTDELKLFREEEAVREEYGDSSNVVEFMKLHKAHGKAFNLLIVDDEPLFRETIKNLINTVHQAKDHIKIDETDSAKQALDLFKTKEIDYLIADIDLGSELMNGYQLSKKVLQEYPNTNVIIHSNKRQVDYDKEIRGINSPKFLGFLSKPMKQSELIQFLAQKSFEARKGVEKTKKRKVLVLNDDDALLMSFKIMLKSSGVDVLEAMDVEGALEHFEKHKIDIILSDINLGEGQPNGYDFLKKVRKENNEIPFYMVSGYSQKEEEPKARKQGANGYLQLPIDKDQLDRIL